MEFGDEYDQFLQTEIRNRRNQKDLLYRFKNDKKFRNIIIALSTLFLLVIIFIIFKIVTYKKPVTIENKFNYIYKVQEPLDENYYTENYKSISNLANREKTIISEMILDYYDLSVLDTSLQNNRNSQVRNYKGLYFPQYKTSLDNIFVNKNNSRINTTSSGSNCLTNSNGECYDDFNQYIFDKFISLSDRETIFNDINLYQSIVYASYYSANNLSSTEYKIPLRSVRKYSSSNMLTYYLDYRKIDITNEILISTELKFYEDIINYFFANYAKIESSAINSILGKNEEITNYLTNKYIKYINLIPEYKNNLLARIEIEIDFVPSELETEYTNMVRGSESWSKSGITTIYMTFEDLWNNLFGDKTYGFMPYQIDLLDNSLLDNTTILRNQEVFYNPLTDKSIKDINDYLDVTYLFDKPIIQYNNIIKYDLINNPDRIGQLAKNIFTAYEKRGQDKFTTEILNGGTITYRFEYIYNYATDKLVIDPSLDIKGFAIGLRVFIIARNNVGQEIGSFIIPEEELNIIGDYVTLK